MTELIGYIGGVCFAICAVPQAWLSYKQGHSEGISWFFLGLWLVGELLTIVYVGAKHGMDLPLMMNYVFNILFISIILKYKIKPRGV